MAIGSFIFDELKISNSCYMAAAIEFNYAMFHIFSGPLFANLQGYVFLDLLIWGVSPILFELCRVPLKKQIKPTAKQVQQNYTRSIQKRRFWWLFLCFAVVLISYLFMNYSPSFRWNYFSRIVNLDFGYLLFDLACRCMELIVEVEQEEQQQRLIDQNRDTLQPLLHRGGYCKYRNIFMMASYFLVFYLSTIYDTDDLGTGKEIFTALSTFSCIFTLAIPFLYLFRYRGENYTHIQSQEEEEEAESPFPVQYSQTDKKTYAAFTLVSFSFFVNTSYFSMWIMQGLSKQNQTPYKQFNKTLFISAAFFLAASFLQFVISHTFIGCKIKEGQMQETSSLHKLIKPFLVGYGALIILVFAYSKMEWHYMIIPILPFGFHSIVVNYFCEIISQWKQHDKKRYGHHKIFFFCESAAYLVIPALLTIVGLGQYAIRIFGYLSALSLIAAGVLA